MKHGEEMEKEKARELNLRSTDEKLSLLCKLKMEIASSQILADLRTSVCASRRVASLNCHVCVFITWPCFPLFISLITCCADASGSYDNYCQ